MYEKIDRAEIYDGTVESRLQYLDKFLNDIEGHIYDQELKSFGNLAVLVYDGLQAAIISGRSRENIWRYMNLAKDLFIASYTNVKYQGKRIYIYIEGKSYQIKKSKTFTGNEDYDIFVSPYWWLVAYSLCELLIDIENRNFLIEEITEEIIEIVNKEDEILKSELALIRCIKALNFNIPFEEKLNVFDESWVTNNNEELFTDDKIKFYKHFIVTNLTSLANEIILKPDEERFNAILFDVIRQHKIYYEAYDHDLLPEAWTNFIVMALLLPSILQDNYKLYFESDYLEMWIVNKSIDLAR